MQQCTDDELMLYPAQERSRLRLTVHSLVQACPNATTIDALADDLVALGQDFRALLGAFSDWRS